MWSPTYSCPSGQSECHRCPWDSLWSGRPPAATSSAASRGSSGRSDGSDVRRTLPKPMCIYRLLVGLLTDCTDKTCFFLHVWQECVLFALTVASLKTAASKSSGAVSCRQRLRCPAVEETHLKAMKAVATRKRERRCSPRALTAAPHPQPTRVPN